MVERIAAAPARYPFSFVVIGDTGAWPDPTADATFAQLLRQTAELRPAPVFFANLGDFAGPGTPERHKHYLELVAGPVDSERLPDREPRPRGRARARRGRRPTGRGTSSSPTGTRASSPSTGPRGRRAISATRDRPTQPARASRRFFFWTTRSPQPASRIASCYSTPRRISTDTTRRSPSAASRRASRSSSTSSVVTTSSWSAAPTASVSTTTSATASAS